MIALMKNCDYALMTANSVTMLFGENAVEMVKITSTWERDHLGRFFIGDQDGRAPEGL